MKPPPRRAQPSWISDLGRRLIRQGSLAVVTAALAMLLVFLLGAMAVGNILSDDGRAAIASEAVAASATDAEALTFSEKLQRADRAIHDVLMALALSAPGTSFEVSSTRTVGDRSFQYRYRAIPYTSDVPFEQIVARIRERVADPAAAVEVMDNEFDSKTFQVLIVIEGLATHSMVFTRSREEDDSDRQAPDAERHEERAPDSLRLGKPRVAIIIDDIGYREQLDREFLALDASITFSILPFTPGGPEFAEAAYDAGREIMLHMPMEPIDFPTKTPGRGALYMGDTPAEIADNLDMAMKAVPYFVGVNNHMGSRFTQDEERMKIVLAKVSEQDLFFIDSFTHQGSIAYDLAQEMGVPSARRTVFLDNEPEFTKVNERLAELIARAQKNGFAIGIGHPNKATLKALKTYLPNLPVRGVTVVPASELVY